MWNDVRRNRQHFVSSNVELLELLELKVLPTRTKCHALRGTSGRRKLAFEDGSERSKRRKSKQLRKTVCFPELIHVTKMSLRSAGKTDAAKLCNEVVFNRNICR